MLLEEIALRLAPSWEKVIGDELQKPYFQRLAAFLDRESAEGKEVYPPKELIFNAFSETPYEKVRVVIVGQDPYHGPGQAHGLAFSVPDGITQPPSLVNVFKELKDDVGVLPPKSGNLLPLARQGVLLVNTVLTVRRGEPLSHKDKGWEQFTDAVVKSLVERKEPLVFLLWGRHAERKVAQYNVRQNGHKVFVAPHPSPFSAHTGFFGCRHFSLANRQLRAWGLNEIDWGDINKNLT